MISAKALELGLRGQRAGIYAGSRTRVRWVGLKKPIQQIKSLLRLS